MLILGWRHRGDPHTSFLLQIERLREEGMKILQREQELMKQQIEEERKRTEASARSEEDFHPTPKLKVTTLSN